MPPSPAKRNTGQLITAIVPHDVTMSKLTSARVQVGIKTYVKCISNYGLTLSYMFNRLHVTGQGRIRCEW